MSAAANKFRQALASHQSGDLAAAENQYRKILAKAPLEVSVLYHLGVVLHQQAKAAEARQVLAKTVANAPDFPEAHFSLGVVLMELGRKDEAESALRRVISLRPHMQQALLRLGELLVFKQQYAEAASLLRNATQLRDSDTKAWVSLTVALRHLNLLEEAIEANNRALALNGRDDNQHAQMADLIYLLYRHDPESARQHAHRWIAAFPDNAFAQHIGSGVLGLPAPDRASDSYVKKLFDNFAESFEGQLARIGYQVADIVAGMTESAGSKGDLVILDAGCGTGLAATSLRQKAGRLVGVDISPRMLEKARGKGLYDELVEMELGDFLKTRKAAFDMIVVYDVFIYFGDLASILGDAAHALLPGGSLAFSVECGDEGCSFTLGPHGRYSHGKGYIMDVIKQSGLHMSKMQETVLRHEFGKAVKALLILAIKPE